MKVRGSVMPPEWDFTSSAVTVYHRTNVVEIATENGAEWEYDEETYAHAEAPFIMMQLAVTELAETQAADQTANELALVELAEMMGG